MAANSNIYESITQTFANPLLISVLPQCGMLAITHNHHSAANTYKGVSMSRNPKIAIYLNNLFTALLVLLTDFWIAWLLSCSCKIVPQEQLILELDVI